MSHATHAADAADAANVTIRALAPSDLDAVVAIDTAIEGRTRRDYIERRLQAARREPALHAQFAAAGPDGVVGHILARVLTGEFGRPGRALRLELLGVREPWRGAGIGRQLLEALSAWAIRHGCGEIRSAASWRDVAMLHWFDSLGFRLAPDRIVGCAVDADDGPRARDEPAPADDDAGREVDYGRQESRGANDNERMAWHIDVQTMTPADLDTIVRIDRRITGGDRRDYIAARLAEAMGDSGVRVSLCARCDGTPAGYLMARADLGDFGRPEPVAVIDTLGVDPGLAHRGIGHALLRQLFANLGALRVERVETLVRHDDFALLGFLNATGFEPSDRLSFVRRLEGA